MMPLCHVSLYKTMLLCSAILKRLSTKSTASSVIRLSNSRRSSLYLSMLTAFSLACDISPASIRSTASLPFIILPEALILGPILKAMSLTVMGFLLNPQISIIPRNPKLGLAFNRFNPKCIITRFSPVMGTISAAILIATKSSNGSISENAKPLRMEKA